MVSVLRPGQRHISIPGFVTTSRRAMAAAAVADWWPVAGKTCVCAYQPKGAASYVASKVNLSNPATHTATNGTAYPTWSTSGWSVNGSQWLITDLVPASDQSWSWLISFNNSTIDGAYRALCGSWGAISASCCMPCFGGGGLLNRYFNYAYVAPAMSSGVMAVAGTQGYRNGSPDGDPWAAGSGNLANFFIGCNNKYGSAGDFAIATITAFAMYSDTLTAGEVASVSAAMAAL